MVRGVQLQKQNTEISEVKISRGRQSKTIVYYCYMTLQYILCTFISPNISLSLLCSKHYTTIPLWIQPICIWIDGRFLSKIHSSLLLHPSSLLFCPSDLCVLPDWPSWFNDLAQTGHSDRTGEKESQNFKQTEWDSLLLTDQNSPISSLRFIFYFLLSPVALVSLYLQFIPLSFSDTAIHFSLPLKIPVPSSAFISNDHSSLPLSPSLFLCSFSEEWQTCRVRKRGRGASRFYIKQKHLRAHKHTSTEHSSFFVISTKLM